MAFVCEKASPEDVRRYRLREMWDTYCYHKGRPFPEKAEWGIDRETGNYLMFVDRTSRENDCEPWWLLVWNGRATTMWLFSEERDLSREGPKDSRPLLIRWHLGIPVYSDNDQKTRSDCGDTFA